MRLTYTLRLKWEQKQNDFLIAYIDDHCLYNKVQWIKSKKYSAEIKVEQVKINNILSTNNIKTFVIKISFSILLIYCKTIKTPNSIILTNKTIIKQKQLNSSIIASNTLHTLFSIIIMVNA